MKRIIGMILSVIFLLGFNNAIAAENQPFKDVKAAAWYAEAVYTLTGKNIISGYGDGTFRPKGSVGIDHFIKMVVIALGNDVKDSKGYWAQSFIDKAKAMDIVKDGEFKDYTKPINRQEMARILVRALSDQYEEDIKKYQAYITDFDYVYDTFEDYVLKAYSKGLLSGYDDGTFGPVRKMTRAEAATVIIRLIDPAKRPMPKAILDVIKAKPDKVFEDFMNQDDSDKYYSKTFFTVKDGLVIWNGMRWGGYGETAVSSPEFKDLNVLAYNTIKDLITYARMYNHYVRAFYNASQQCIIISYYTSQNKGEKAVYDGEFSITFLLRPIKINPSDIARTHMIWDLNYLWENTHVPSGDPVTEPYCSAFKSMFINVYGGEKGQALYEYIIKEYREAWKTKGRKEYPHDKVNGIDVMNFQGNAAICFKTNR